MHSKVRNTQAVLTVLFVAECPEHGLKSASFRSRFQNVKTDVLFKCLSLCFLNILLYEYSYSWLAADPTSRLRPSGCVLKTLPWLFMPAFHCWYVTQADSWHYCHTLYKLNWLFTADLTLKGKIGLVFCDGFLHMVHICIGYIKTSPIFRSTPKSRPNNIYMGLKCPSVRPSNKSFSDSDEIWYVGRGWRVMHDGMPYDQIRGQGHETFKVRNSSIISSAIFNVSWQMTTDSETTEQYLTFVWSRFLISVLVFVSHDYKLGTAWHW